MKRTFIRIAGVAITLAAAAGDLKTALMLCNNENFTARLILGEDVELDMVERKLVAQLGNAITVTTVPSAPGSGRISLAVHDVMGGQDIEKRF